jgi:hypothetical protein
MSDKQSVTYEECVDVIMSGSDFDDKIQRFVDLCYAKCVKHDVYMQIVPSVLDYGSIETFATYHNPPICRMKYILDIYPIPNPLPDIINNTIVSTLFRGKSITEIHNFLMKIPEWGIKLKFSDGRVNSFFAQIFNMRPNLNLGKFSDMVQIFMDMDTRNFMDIFCTIFAKTNVDPKYIEHLTEIALQYNLDVSKIITDNHNYFDELIIVRTPVHIKILLDLIDPNVVAAYILTVKSKGAYGISSKMCKILVECAKRGVDISTFLIENEDKI